MPEISKIKLPSGTVYDIKDATARQTASGAIKIKGTTTTALTDESTTNPITINSQSYTAVANDAVFYNKKEFVFDGTKWHEFGDMSGLGNMAYANTATGSVTPSGTVSQPTFSGNGVTITGSTTASGTVSQPTFSGSAMTSTGTFTPSGSVSLTNSNTTATVSKASSGTATYTPEGSVSAPTISVATAGSTTTIKNPTSVTVAKTVATAAPGATAPSNAVTWCAMDTTDTECLNLYQIGYTTGDSITTTNVTVRDGDAAYEASTPSFTGTGVRLVTGNISVPTSASFSGSEGSVSVSGTPEGTVSQPSFSGSSSSVSITVTDTASGSTPTYTPSGTVSQPTFSGSSGSVTVSPDAITP